MTLHGRGGEATPCGAEAGSWTQAWTATPRLRSHCSHRHGLQKDETTIQRLIRTRSLPNFLGLRDSPSKRSVVPRERGSCRSNRLRPSRPAAGPFPAVGRKGGPGRRHRLEQSTGKPGRGLRGPARNGPVTRRWRRGCMGSRAHREASIIGRTGLKKNPTPVQGFSSTRRSHAALWPRSFSAPHHPHRHCPSLCSLLSASGREP